MFLCKTLSVNLSVVCCVVVFQNRESCNCISVTQVSAASRAAVSSVMSEKSISVPRDGVVVVVGEYRSIEEITSAIIAAAQHRQILLLLFFTFFFFA